MTNERYPTVSGETSFFRSVSSTTIAHALFFHLNTGKWISRSRREFWKLYRMQSDRETIARVEIALNRVRDAIALAPDLLVL